MNRSLVAPIVLAALCASLPARAEPSPVDPFFGRDKALHFGFSAALAGGGYGLTALAVEDRPSRAVLGLTLSLGAGYAKEVADAMGLGTPSWKDLVWDVIGSAVGVSIAVSLDAALSTSPRATIAPRP